MPARDPDNPLSEMPTDAERAAAWPKFAELRGSCSDLDVLRAFRAERDAERQASCGEGSGLDRDEDAGRRSPLVEL